MSSLPQRLLGEPQYEPPLAVYKPLTIDAQSPDNRALYELTSEVGSPLKLTKALEHLLGLCLREMDCRTAFIYLYDQERERLVLVTASGPYQTWTGRLEITLGAGLIGRIGLTLRPLIAERLPTDDPHGQPDLGVEQAILALPIVNHQGHLVGVLGVHQSSYAFLRDRTSQLWLAQTAALIAGLVEQETTQAQVHHTAAIMMTLTNVSRVIGSHQPFETMLATLVTLLKELLEADLCLIMLPDQERKQLSIQASAPSFDTQALQIEPLSIDMQTWEQLRRHPGPGQVIVDPLKDAHYKASLSVPLLANAEPLGLINCYFNQTRSNASEDYTLLCTVANQIALAVSHHYLAQHNQVGDLLDRLCDCASLHYQEQLALIADYDSRKDADLLRTLEVYLMCAGNVTDAAQTLKIHRNTLLQRLDRLRSLIELDLDERCHWFALQLALRVYHLRATGALI